MLGARRVKLSNTQLAVELTSVTLSLFQSKVKGWDPEGRGVVTDYLQWTKAKSSWCSEN